MTTISNQSELLKFAFDFKAGLSINDNKLQTESGAKIAELKFTPENGVYNEAGKKIESGVKKALSENNNVVSIKKATFSDTILVCYF
jgi:hypothetical protein